MQSCIKNFLLFLCLIQPAFAALSLDQATKRIIEKNKNKVLGAKTEKIEGIDIHVIKILTADGRVQYLKIDANSGKVIK